MRAHCTKYSTSSSDTPLRSPSHARKIFMIAAWMFFIRICMPATTWTEPVPRASPGADVAAERPVPAQMWHGWAGRAGAPARRQRRGGRRRRRPGAAASRHIAVGTAAAATAAYLCRCAYWCVLLPTTGRPDLLRAHLLERREGRNGAERVAARIDPKEQRRAWHGMRRAVRPLGRRDAPCEWWRSPPTVLTRQRKVDRTAPALARWGVGL
jgi:hypothetical protein